MKITYSEPLQEEVTPSGEGTKTVSMSKKVKIEDASVERLVEEIEECEVDMAIEIVIKAHINAANRQ